MSPREKGRYLRAAGWISLTGFGLHWRDPQNRMGGALTTSQAFAVQRERDAKRAAMEAKAKQRREPANR